MKKCLLILFLLVCFSVIGTASTAFEGDYKVIVQYPKVIEVGETGHFHAIVIFKKEMGPFNFVPVYSIDNIDYTTYKSENGRTVFSVNVLFKFNYPGRYTLIPFSIDYEEGYYTMEGQKVSVKKKIAYDTEIKQDRIALNGTIRYKFWVEGLDSMPQLEAIPSEDFKIVDHHIEENNLKIEGYVDLKFKKPGTYKVRPLKVVLKGKEYELPFHIVTIVPFKVDIIVDKRVYYAGDRFTFTLKVHPEGDATVQASNLIAFSPSFAEVLKRRSDGQGQVTMDCIIFAKPGKEYRLGNFLIPYTTSDGEKRSFHSPSIPIKVNSLVTSEPQGFRGFQLLPVRGHRIWQIAFFALTVIGLWFFLFFFLRLFFSSEEEIREDEIESARNKLRDLKDKMDRGAVGWVGIRKTIRNFLGVLYDFEAECLTTPEILDRMPEDNPKLYKVLHELDCKRFSKQYEMNIIEDDVLEIIYQFAPWD